MKRSGHLQDTFHHLAVRLSGAAGSAYTFIGAVLTVALWAAVGPLFDFSESWQLSINTGTTIITFLMVFLIQNSQNRDARAVHLKLNELLHGVSGARTELVDLEELPEDALQILHNEFRQMHLRYAAEVEKRHERKQSRMIR